MTIIIKAKDRGANEITLREKRIVRTGIDVSPGLLYVCWKKVNCRLFLYDAKYEKDFLAYIKKKKNTAK